MITVKETLALMADASDQNVPKIAIFRPAITKATCKKNGDVTITLTLVTNEFTVNDVMEGLVAWLAVGTIDAVKALQEGRRPQ